MFPDTHLYGHLVLFLYVDFVPKIYRQLSVMPSIFKFQGLDGAFLPRRTEFPAHVCIALFLIKFSDT
jgi:hypothetical protein